MEHHITQSRLSTLLVGVFLVSFSLLAFEIALARLLSVILSYHYVFAVVSLSLFGIGIGGIFIHFSQKKTPDKAQLFHSLSLFSGFCSLAMTLSPLVAIQVGHLETVGTNIFLYWVIFIFPFVFGGMFLAKVFSSFPALGSMIYGSDLIGAASACLGVVLALNIFSPVCAIFFFAGVTSISSVLFSFNRNTA
ncbi:MAG: hypothetical protein JRH18_02440 [Deltaproteobacteria bacterium]|nr:hypothetical protein [Deltaproteobacteria bacterium]MBW1961076.1 hypothetical protein [Deltaproteobacteria bacterium]MBW2150507.1 hypothetical protein [Deltaproteobacteria bacterium]